MKGLHVFGKEQVYDLFCLTDERLGVVAALVTVLNLSQVKVVELCVLAKVILDLQAKSE